MPSSIDTTAPVIPPTATDNSKAESTQPPSAAAQAKAQLNSAIVEAALAVSISSQNEPLALLYKTAIDNLNEVLKPELGENAIQNAANQDNTPEGTAGRIVSLSTAFFGAYQAQHPEQDAATSLNKFMAIIRGGFERGYGEATDILKGLKVFEGDIAGNIEKTYALVQQGYADFESAQSARA